MTVEPLRPEDAPALMELAAEWKSGPIVISPGAHGVVVRGAGCVLAWALLREMNQGFVVDELWCSQSRAGRLALAEVARWLETTVARVAVQRGVEYIELGGIVRVDNPAHDAALAKRGYQVVANVRAKRIYAREAVAV